jgi:calcineurin-like phosphoesterase family protein
LTQFRRRIICNNIHLILGNHDHHIEDLDKGLQELFSSVDYYREINVGKKRLVLSHYSHRIWNGSHFGALHLYGHSHSNLEHLPHGKSMDVGVDNAFKLLGEYRPFSFKEILSFLDKRTIVFLDHHKADSPE